MNLILKIKAKTRNSTRSKQKLELNEKIAVKDSYSKKQHEKLVNTCGITFTNQLQLVYKWVPFGISIDHKNTSKKDCEVSEEEEKINIE